MQVTGLFHVAIKTNDLDATVKFYTDVLGMKLVHRPDFGFPGAWIAAGDSIPIIHIYAEGDSEDVSTELEEELRRIVTDVIEREETADRS